MENTPNVYRAKSKQNKTFSPKNAIKIAIIIFVLVLLAIGAFFGYKVLNDVYGFKNYNINTQITIPSGANTTTISNLLAKEGIIKYPSIFVKFSNKNAGNKPYKPGLHTFDKISGYKNIISKLQQPGEDIFSITFPEGFTVTDIANKFAKFNFGTYDDILKEMNEYDTSKFDFLQNLPDMEKRNYKLEGYIFPDTYTDILPTDTVSDVITRCLNNTKTQLEKNDIKSKAENLGFTLDEAIILSTIIQKEVSDNKNMKQVSAVFHNRLNIKMKLQSDPTVSYALGGKKALTTADTRTASPYNTYYIDRLPIGPICNPGIDAILATVNPDESYQKEKYLYFYSIPSGETFFTKTYPEHLEIIKQHRSAWIGAIK